MELRRYFNLIRQRLLLVVVAVLAGAAVGYLITSRTPTYTATATVFVGYPNVGSSGQYLYEYADLPTVVSTYAILITEPVVAQKAINETHIDRLAGQVSADTSALVEPTTQLITVSLIDTNAADAVRLDNAMCRAFTQQVTTIGTTVPAHVAQPAIYAAANSTGLGKHLGLGAAFGLIISIFVILLLDYLDITIKSPEELERRVGLPVLGVIPRFDTLRLDNSPTGSFQRTLPRGVSG
ncbi:MAG TPA: Wzz/FepE/Etk N-terminal domain-containing protein [Acidimicrobiales bacterium]|nr:Wzz/FepE/Etk N-terminal domain-containing protein [Acidimicrobiales bacterium]